MNIIRRGCWYGLFSQQACSVQGHCSHRAQGQQQVAGAPQVTGQNTSPEGKCLGADLYPWLLPPTPTPPPFLPVFSDAGMRYPSNLLPPGVPGPVVGWSGALTLGPGLRFSCLCTSEVRSCRLLFPDTRQGEQTGSLRGVSVWETRRGPCRLLSLWYTTAPTPRPPHLAVLSRVSRLPFQLEAAPPDAVCC